MSRNLAQTCTLLALCALTGCAWITEGELKALQDQDQDGYASTQFGGDDCDDADAAVHPDADERCNGADDNCDGALMEGEGDGPVTWYVDGDDDGLGGSETVEVTDCEAPEGYTLTPGDCDDTNPDASPSAVEICDGIDNDCDTLLDDDDSSLTDAPTWYLDGDGDGYGTAGVAVDSCDAPANFVSNSEDCDDGDDAIHPGAEERCDDVDEDCDGEADDSAVDVTTWYGDGDGDGYGDDAVTTTACDAPSGAVAEGGDCDDDEAAVHPGAAESCTDSDTNCDGQPGAVDEDADGWRGCDGDCDDGDPTVSPEADEICNSSDDDCDGLVDDEDEDRVTTGLDRYYQDADADGYGDEDDAGTYACSLPEGLVEEHTDCDDGDGSVHPGAVEVCSTTEDDDCDGATSDCAVTFGADGLSWVGVAEGDRAGAGTLAADLDGDGTDELAFAAPGRASAKGSLYVVLDPATSSEDLGASVEWKGSAASDRAGEALIGGVDVDGDGLEDLAVGAPGGEAAYLLAGPAASGGGLTGADVIFTGPDERSDFGAALALGDLNGDGEIDAALGAPLQDQVVTYVLTTSDAGQVDLFWGPLSGDLDVAGADGTVIDNDETSGQLGRALAPADADGDGVQDLVLSAFDYNLGSLTPKIYLLDVSGGGAMDSGDVERTFSGSAGRTSGGALAAGGDVDGDGTDDLLVGDGDAAQAFLLLGPLQSAPTTLSGADGVISGSEGFGLAVRVLTDLDGDGKDEVAVGGDNSVCLWMGGAGLTGAVSTSSADLTVEGARSADDVGASLDAGDVDGDGAADLVIGAPGADSDIGAAWALPGPF